MATTHSLMLNWTGEQCKLIIIISCVLRYNYLSIRVDAVEILVSNT